MAYAKALPQATPETQEFWDGLKRHELRIQRCQDCNQFYFFPRPFCPHAGCRSSNVEWETVSGKGKLHTYVISHRGFGPWGEDVPYVIAVVELDEGPRMMTNLVNVEPEPEKLPPDMALEIVYDDVTDEVTLPKFQPAS
jgi:hypothetical protein